jgi:hypothetical protein
MAVSQLVLELRGDSPAPPPEMRKRSKLALGYFVSLVAYLLLILLVGFGVATVLFTFAFLYGWVRPGLVTSLVYTAIVIGLALLMSRLLGMYWPEGILLGQW